MRSPPPTRREILKYSAAALCLAGLGGGASSTSAETPVASASTKLASVLRAIGGPVCDQAATRIERDRSHAQSITLHLRGAGLTPAQGKRLAETLRELSGAEARRIASISFSYNDTIGDPAAIDLIGALPPRLPELGMVGCGIGDKAGEALLNWAVNAPALRVLCIEQNRFSAPLRARFATFARANPHVLTVV